jgi:hypothetical protein
MIRIDTELYLTFLYFSSLVPSNTSEVLRRFIEALFITHANTKLNTTGHLDQWMVSSEATLNSTSSLETIIWCDNLIHR